MHLPDGRRLIRHDRHTALCRQLHISPTELNSKGVISIHPDFRLLAVGCSPERDNQWLASETLSTFSIFELLTPLTIKEKIDIATLHSPVRSTAERRLLDIVSQYCSALHDISYLGSETSTSKASTAGSTHHLSLSCRQIIRLWKSSLTCLRTQTPESNIHEAVISHIHQRLQGTLLVPFMPESLKASFGLSLKTCEDHIAKLPWAWCDLMIPEIVGNAVSARSNPTPDSRIVQFGGVSLVSNPPLRPDLVPDTLFFNVDAHVKHLEDIARDVAGGERHILLIGNQGRVMHDLPLKTSILVYDIHLCYRYREKQIS